jgi:hypothetical protein
MVEAMYSLELETSEKITQSKDSKKTKWKALEIRNTPSTRSIMTMQV